MLIGTRLLFLCSVFLLGENLAAALGPGDEPALPCHGQKEGSGLRNVLKFQEMRLEGLLDSLALH